MSNYAAKTDLKNATGNHTSKLAAKSDLVSLKADTDESYLEKKIHDTSKLAKNTDYNAKISEIARKSKIPSINGLVTTSPINCS